MQPSGTDLKIKNDYKRTIPEASFCFSKTCVPHALAFTTLEDPNADKPEQTHIQDASGPQSQHTPPTLRVIPRIT